MMCTSFFGKEINIIRACSTTFIPVIGRFLYASCVLDSLLCLGLTEFLIRTF